jgi:lipopolysaccharide transport system ATP-binding protein
MPAPAITVENLSKRYLVGHRAERAGGHSYTALRDILAREMRNAARKAVDVVRGRQVVQGDAVEEFWALKDVSFSVNEGEVVGIIGRNGAGKSTLLKILSRITEPTSGRVTLRGRVASLLEVGTGFHPELTGRENIYLNGAILGMSRAEIRRKFDEIVAFAEIEKFLDTPVKRYSSGMYVRLAFAVAAHLEPEILIVDEVLAVGDVEFQKKCLGKMDEVSRRDGRTVLLVSHNMSSVAGLASRALFLDHGSVALDGSAPEAIAAYIANGHDQPIYIRDSDDRRDHPHIARIEVRTSEPDGVQRFGAPLEVKIWVQHQQPMSKPTLSFQIMNQQQNPAIHSTACYPDVRFGRDPGCSSLSCKFPNLHLNVGRYYLRVFLSEPPGAETYETLDGVAHFEVVRTDRPSPWGWRADACIYHEDYAWEVTGALAETAL